MRRSNGSPPAASTRVVCPRWSPPWPLLLPFALVVGLVACAPSVTGASAGASGGGRKEVCGTTFLDAASSAILADVVLEGRVREKMHPSPSGTYNVTIQVRKQAWKGKELVNGGRRARKLPIGLFHDAPSSSSTSPSSPPQDVAVVSDGGAVNGAGGGRRGRGRRRRGDDDDNDDVVAGGGVDVTDVNCVGQVSDGATYIFFLKDVGDRKGRYFRISALPVKKTRRLARTINRVLKKNGARKPKVQLKGSTSVTKGSSLTLRCKARAKPNPVFTWFYNGQPIKPNSRQRIKSGKRGSRLKIKKADAENSGVYTCQAKNAVGEDTQNVTVKVTAPELTHKACEKQTFCFNGGTCRYIPELQQTFCQCPESFEGKRCEKEVAHPSIFKGEATLLYERTLIIVGIVIALLVFVVICIASYFLANRRRKRWEEKRRLKQRQAAERERLLDRPDGPPHVQYIPCYKPQAQKETQTDNDLQPPDNPPPRREHDSEPNFVSYMPNNSDNIFLRNKSFPLNATAPPSDVNPALRPARPMSDQPPRDLERRGSRSRLKAVSVDDSCADRPKSWKAEVPDSKSMPVIRDGSEGGESKEKIEMDDLGQRSPPPPGVSSSSPGLSAEGPAVVVPTLPDFLSSPELMSVPVRMESQPRDNAHAQLKSPGEEESYRPAVLPPDYSSFGPQPEEPRAPEPALPAPLPVNGVRDDLESEEDDDDEEEEAEPLPVLHISEEDLNGNVPKPDSFESDFLPPPPPPDQLQAADPVSPSLSSPTSSSSAAGYPRPKNLSSLLDGVYVPPVGHSPGSGSEDDSAGFLPRTLSSTEASSPVMDGGTPTYSFDPCMDSDPGEFDDQFMHGSPKKGAGPFGGPEDKQDYDRRLQNVRADQEAIPI